MDTYFLVKTIHISAAIISLLGFVVRGYWMLTDNPCLKRKLSKILPHVNDTVLLGAAIYLSVMSQQYPFSQDWLTGKVFLLVGYIIAGTIALKRGKTLRQRVVALSIALICIAGIFTLALSKPMF